MIIKVEIIGAYYLTQLYYKYGGGSGDWTTASVLTRTIAGSNIDHR